MPLTAAPLSGQAPLIQVTIPTGTVPKGMTYTVTGTTPTGWTWDVRGGHRVSEGTQVVLGDPLAPINQPVTYRLTTPTGLVTESNTVTRPWTGHTLLTDITSTTHIDLLWQGNDPHTLDMRVTTHDIPGRHTPVPVFAPTMGAGTTTLTARTTGTHTHAMTALAARPAVVALYHNPLRCFQCRVGACDVEPVTVMVLTDVSHSRSARVDVAERSWSLKGALVAVPEPEVVLATSTWADFDRVRFTWGTLQARRMTWDQFDRTVWQEVGR